MRSDEEEVAGNLLRDGRAALAAAAGQHVGECGADDAGDLDAGVFVEAVVLGGENGVLDVVGHFGEAHEVAALLPNSPMSLPSALQTRSGTRGR